MFYENIFVLQHIFRIDSQWDTSYIATLLLGMTVHNSYLGFGNTFCGVSTGVMYILLFMAPFTKTHEYFLWDRWWCM